MSISDSDYQGRFKIPTPKGVYQAAGDTNINTDYAYLAREHPHGARAFGFELRHEPRVSGAGRAD